MEAVEESSEVIIVTKDKKDPGPGKSLNFSLCVVCNCSCTTIFQSSGKEDSAGGVKRKRSRQTSPKGPASSSEYSSEFVKKLDQFQEDLRKFIGVSKCSDGFATVTKRNDKRKSLQADKTLPSSPLNVCSNCQVLLSVAIESKSDLVDMESHVRNLQEAILQALRMLDKQRERFLRDMQKIEEKITPLCKVASHSVLSPKGKRRGNRSCDRNKLGDDLGACEFRENILKVLADLRSYQDDKLDKKKSVTSKNSTLSQAKTLGHKGLSLEKSSTAAVATSYYIKEEVDGDFIVALEVEPDGVDISSMTEEVQGCGEPDNDQDVSMDDDDDDLEYQDDSNDKDYTEVKRTRTRKTKSFLRGKANSSVKKAQKRLSAIPYPRDIPFLKANPRAYYSGRQGPAFDEFLAGMSSFKATIVMRTFNKKKRRARPGNKSPLTNHFVTYNPDTDTLSVDNSIPIKINDEAKTLECSVCSLQVSKPQKDSCHWNIEKKMMYHILGKHMDAFRCEECDETFPVYTAYFLHKKMHANGNPTCDVCGKRMPSELRLEEHKWVHMTSEEKEQAKGEGKVDPNDRNRNLPRVHQCDLCGKSFKKPYELRLHNSRKHVEKPEMSFMCNGCGKIFKAQRNLTVHQRHKCVMLGGETVVVDEVVKNESDLFIV